MKIFAHHDATGVIRSLITIDAPAGVNAGLAPQPGQFVTEVEGLKLTPGDVDMEKLREIAATHRVVLPSQRSVLVRKRKSGKRK